MINQGKFKLLQEEVDFKQEDLNQMAYSDYIKLSQVD